MERKPLTVIVFPIAAIFGLVSCATMRTTGGNSVAAVKNSTSSAISRMSDLPLIRLLPGRSPTVVEVREKDLKEMPTGHELAQAYEKRRRGFWIFGGPVDFQEPSLPEQGASPDGSLLPPRLPD